MPAYERASLALTFPDRSGSRPLEEVEAMLDAVPDLRPAIETATGEELAAIFRAFGVRDSACFKAP